MSLEKLAVENLLEGFGKPPICVALGDGNPISVSNEPILATIIIKNRATLLKLVCSSETQFGDAFASGDIEIDGDLVALMEMLFSRWKRKGQSRLGRLFSALLSRSANTLGGSRKNIQHHYDIGNDFYKLWLDSQMVYTCAYFPLPSCSLEQAQIAKMDYVCRKLQLHTGDRVVEAGCGWGALALHMAKYYGASVKAFNISHEQILYARQRARKEGLTEKVHFIEEDYRNMRGRFDVFVSVGMLEHVGRKYYQELGAVMDRCLKSTGRGLLHFIGRNHEYRVNPWLQRRIFPGAYSPTLRQMMEILEPRNFSVLDVENLRLHYAKTLEHWLERFEKSADLIERMFDLQFLRAWRLYLASSLAAFRTGWLQLFQTTFSRPANNQIAWTRENLYRTHLASKARRTG